VRAQERERESTVSAAKHADDHGSAAAALALPGRPEMESDIVKPDRELRLIVAAPQQQPYNTDV